MCFCFFFFKQKTAYEMRISDWSSDVCSSDLVLLHARPRRSRPDRLALRAAVGELAGTAGNRALGGDHRDDLEGSGILHDLLSRCAADDPRGPEGSRRHRGGQPLDLSPTDRDAALDADEAFHTGQRASTRGKPER